MYTLQEATVLNWIQELRIEGHSSSDGNYFNNMELSQQRANAVLQFIWGLPNFSEKEQVWLEQKVASIGMGTKQLIYEKEKEQVQKSRRVTFSLVLKSKTPQKTQVNTPIFCQKSIADKSKNAQMILSIPVNNTENHPLQIKGIITGKDFVAQSWKKQPLLLGESTTIKIAYSSTSQDIFKEYVFKIITNRGTQSIGITLKPYLPHQ